MMPAFQMVAIIKARLEMNATVDPTLDLDAFDVVALTSIVDNTWSRHFQPAVNESDHFQRCNEGSDYFEHGIECRDVLQRGLDSCDHLERGLHGHVYFERIQRSTWTRPRCRHSK